MFRQGFLGILMLLGGGIMQAQSGCTDPQATNYDSLAVNNDGSCQYAATTLPSAAINSYNISPTLNETSGLLWWDGYWWTHNDDTDTNLYGMDSLGVVRQTLNIQDVANIDWEDADSDSSYIYVGDFGNNAQGNRQNLRIYKLSKDSQNIVDTISFYYPEQTDFSAQGSNNTDFDCEAMIAAGDSIYLFTKRHLDARTMLYALPKQSGGTLQAAVLLDSLDVTGLVTGATYVEAAGVVALCGYSSNHLQPFIYLLYDFAGRDFFGGNKRKLQLPTLAHQIEAISSRDGRTFYLTNEYASSGPITVPAKLHKIDLSAYFGAPQPTGVHSVGYPNLSGLRAFPNPVQNLFWIDGPLPLNTDFELHDAQGRLLQKGKIYTENQTFSLDPNLPSGTYYLWLGGSVLRLVK